MLGPVIVSVAGQERTPSRFRLRELLALLLVRAGDPVSSGSLIDELYGNRPPETATTALQVHVSHLRKVLAPGIAVRDPRQRLRTHAGGYLLRVNDGELDVHQFESLADRGIRELAAGNARSASSTLRRALQLWRGPAVADSTAPALAEVFAPWANARRLVVLEHRIEAELADGAGAHLVGELQAMVATHPLRERFWGQLMVALYRAGRQADALAAYQAVRHRLRTTLSCTPSQELRELRDRILAADPALGGRQVAVPHRWPVIVPAQLPACSGAPVGRSHPVRVLTNALTAPEPSTCLVNGGPGAGTTTVALHVAHRVRARFPDGQLYTRLRPDTEPGQVLGAFLVALGHEPDRLPESPAERGQLFRDALAGRRVLIVLDDAGSEHQVRPLCPGTPESRMLVTAPGPLTGLGPVCRVQLGALPEPDALALLAAGTGTARVERESTAARDLVRRCGHLPLAVRITAARIAVRPYWTLRVMAERLSRPGALLAELVAGDLTVRGSLLRRYRSCDRQQRRAFRLLGVLPHHDGPIGDIPQCAITALLGTGPAASAAAAAGLATAGLLERDADCYRLSPPLAELSVELLATGEHPAEVSRARGRLACRDAERRAWPALA